MLKVHLVSQQFVVDDEKINALKDVSFEVKIKELVAIIGPSGCGKSTLLRILANLEQQTSGEVTWDESPRIGFVFQNYALFPFLTVFENIAFGLKMQGVAKQKQRQVVKELIDEMGLSGFENKHPKELSGGMKQRVGIARALAIDPNVLLLDEPFSSLDEFTAETLRTLLLDIWQKRKITIILVTHLVSEAIELADRVIAMTPPPGHVEAVVANALARPRNLRSKEFFAMEDKLVKLVKV